MSLTFEFENPQLWSGNYKYHDLAVMINDTIRQNLVKYIFLVVIPKGGGEERDSITVVDFIKCRCATAFSQAKADVQIMK